MMAKLEHSHERTRREVAEYLRTFAAKLDPGGSSPAPERVEMPEEETDTRKLTLVSGNASATINPPDTLAFDVEIDTDSGLLEAGNEHSATFRIRWDASHVEADDELSIA